MLCDLCFHSTYEELKRVSTLPVANASLRFHSTYEELKLGKILVKRFRICLVFILPMRN
ncbi:hypothetical protein KsCSTR_13200 [Candidatus Kuenenia stuttgartiensis]|uniref:Uncharacterized protein n=1 Tax=Kuenenia stuttgartiensis TaxID=174633 RepID=Q1Q0Y9_KUEST|nr:hypothetical protein KsCSTR_13200 [Candidatus Kuenenia stuttgartiensis]CAJ73668.1 unknown protein [Candidatus Kuenenia stuttgartiensis]